MSSRIEFQFQATEGTGDVSATLDFNSSSKAVLVLAHGAGAGMMHFFMEELSQNLFSNGIGVLKFNFPYMEGVKGRPDPPARAIKTIHNAILEVEKRLPGLPIFIGGKSFGGRMASHLAASLPDLTINGLIYFGFPLHAPGKPGVDRATHLKNIKVPMLFLQGTRDSLATPELINQVINNLSLATLIYYEGADHSFKVLKKMNISPEEMMNTLSKDASEWMFKLI